MSNSSLNDRHEAMIDLVNILGSLVDTHGNIKIAGIHDTVKALSEEEKALYRTIQFDVASFMWKSLILFCWEISSLALKGEQRPAAFAIVCFLFL